jgi:hypothetical protein
MFFSIVPKWLYTIFSQSTEESHIQSTEESHIQSTEESHIKWVTLPRPKDSFASIIFQNLRGNDNWHILKAPAFYGPGNAWKGVSEESPQTSDELRIISLNSQQIESELEDCSVLTEFGPG